jgi:hypothetical protein
MAQAGSRSYPDCVMIILEIAVIVISVVGFVVLDLYVLGCEKV